MELELRESSEVAEFVGDAKLFSMVRTGGGAASAEPAIWFKYQTAIHFTPSALERGGG